ncbi:MAG TPA: hypothetical protein VIV58_35085 [Kofleriaceae bacterium]
MLRIASVVFAASIAIAARAPAARADSSVVITLTPAGAQLADYLHLSVDQLKQNEEDKFNALFQTANLPALLSAFASTTAIADRGLGVDYGVLGTPLMVGVVANGAVPTDSSLSGNDERVIGGFVFNFGAMLGANLGRWGAPKWTLYANGFYETAGYKDLQGDLTTGGVHAQYRAIAGGRGSVHWIGLDVTTGLELAKWTISTKRDSLQINFKVENMTGDSEHLEFDSKGVMNVEADATTIPLEVTSGISLGDLFVIYGGGGLDLTFATSTIDVNLDGDVLIRDNQENVGHATVTANGQASPGTASVHALAGIKLEVPHANIYVQGIATPSDEGVAFGVRATF